MAAAAILPLAGESSEALKRFWGSLVVAAGKTAYERTEVRRLPRRSLKVLDQTDHLFGIERRVRLVGDQVEETRTVKVARWELAAGGIAALVLIGATNRGQSYVSTAKGRLGWNPPTVSIPVMGSVSRSSNTPWGATWNLLTTGHL